MELSPGIIKPEKISNVLTVTMMLMERMMISLNITTQTIEYVMNAKNAIIRVLVELIIQDI